MTKLFSKPMDEERVADRVSEKNHTMIKNLG
jgi:hypothetical protein